MEDGSTLWNKVALFKLSLWVLIEDDRSNKNIQSLGASGKGLSG